MRIRSALILAIALGALVLAVPETSHAQLMLYDDFSSPLINPAKWFAGGGTGGSGNPTTDTRLFTTDLTPAGRQLEIAVRQYGSTSNSGTTGGQARLNVTNPAAITTMQARVTVNSALAESCSTNNPGSLLVRARAEVIGSFFNDGTSPSAGDRTGDFQAAIDKIADTNLGNVIQAFVLRCTNATCSTFTTINFANLVTPWSPNEPHTLTLAWDKTNKRFIMSATTQLGQTETVFLSYTQSDSDPPVNEFKELLVLNSAANCTGSHKQAYMDALFDTVMVNNPPS
jgi:hypothetical protein